MRSTSSCAASRPACRSATRCASSPTRRRSRCAANSARSSRPQALGLSLDEAAEKMAERVPVTRDQFLLDRHRHSVEGGRQSVGSDRQPFAHAARAQEDEGQDQRDVDGGESLGGDHRRRAVRRHRRCSICLRPKYISLLWTTQHGRIVAAIACFWMSIGVVMMKQDDQVRLLRRSQAMLDLVLAKIGDPHFMALLLVALGCAATMLTVVVPLLQTDNLARRMKAVSDRARAHPPARARTHGGQAKPRRRCASGRAVCSSNSSTRSI